MAEELIDSYSESNYNSDNIIYSPNKVGQSFTSNNSYTLTKCKFYIKKTGSPTGNLTASIFATRYYDSSNIKPEPSYVALATSDSIDISTISTSYSLVEFTFSGANQIVLGANCYYCIVLNGVGNSTNCLTYGFKDDATNVIWRALWVNADNLWYSFGGAKLVFYVYGNPYTPTATSGFFRFLD